MIGPPLIPAPEAIDLDPPPTFSRLLLLFSLLAGLLVFVGTQGRTLWSEWKLLDKESSEARRTVLVGYRNIYPKITYASQPNPWCIDDGEATWLWSDWNGGRHRWFKLDRGELNLDLLSQPIGRDAIPAIDYPLTEGRDGPIWGRIPAEASVVGFQLAGNECVYPIKVLEKVFLINDWIEDRPVLVAFNPVQESSKSVHLYDPIVDGHRITLGTSGYFQNRLPLFYDRGTESFWCETAVGRFEAIAGGYKGTSLRLIDQQAPVAWGTWQRQHPHSRLLVGADRSRSVPVD